MLRGSAPAAPVATRHRGPPVGGSAHGSIEHDHAARVAPVGKVVERLRRLVDPVALRDQFVELEPSGAVQRQDAREIVARAARAEVGYKSDRS